MSLYKTCGYVLGVLRPQQFPEDVSETVISQNWYNHIIGFDTSFYSMICPKKSHTEYLQLQKSTANTHFDVLFNLVSSHHWPYFMLIKVRNYLAPNFTTGDFIIRVRGPPANYVYGSHMTLVKRGSLGYSSHQKGVIQGHLVHWYVSRRAPALCSMIMFRTVLSLNVSTQTVFLDYVRKIYLEGLFLKICGVHVTHWLLCQTDENNTVFQSFIGYTYEGTGEF